MSCRVGKGKAATVLAVVLMAGNLWGQRMVAPETALTGNGEFQFGYSGGDGSNVAASQSLYLGVLGSFQGYYRDPRILSFTFSPNWRWDHNSSADTTFGSGDEGVFTTLRFLGGSSIPLSINYSLTRLTEASLTGGVFPITVRSNGLSQNLNLNWSIHKHTPGKPDRWPTLMFGFGKSFSDNTVTGVQAPELTSDSTVFTAQSMYQIAGFHLTGTFTHQDISQSNPNLLDLGLSSEIVTKSQSESVSIGRTFFRNTSVGASYTTSKSDVAVLNAPSNQNFENANAQVSSNPWKPLTLNGTVNYVSNLSAQTIVNTVTGTPTSGSGTGSVVPELLLSTGRQFEGTVGGNYVLSRSWQFTATATQIQSDLYEGIKVDNGTYTAGILFMHAVGKGFLSLSYAPGYFIVDEHVAVDDAQQQFKLHGLINTGLARYTRRIGRWQGTGGFSYSQSNVSQPTVIPLVSRSLTGNLSASTLIAHEWNFTGNYALTKSDFAGANSALSNSFSGSIGNRTWNFMGQYQFNSGYSISTPFGLVPVTGGAPAAVIPSAFYTNADGFSVSAAYRRRRLQATATYGRNGASVTTPLQLVNSGTSTLNALMEYHFRRISFRAGYLRFTEDVSSNNALNQTSNAYYFTLVRPFHLF